MWGAESGYVAPPSARQIKELKTITWSWARLSEGWIRSSRERE